MNEPFFSFQPGYVEGNGQVLTNANLYDHGIDDDDDDGSSINLDRSTGHLPNFSRVSPPNKETFSESERKRFLPLKSPKIPGSIS